MNRFLTCLGLLLLLTSCQIDGLQLQMSEGWTYRSLAAWKHADPSALTISADGHWLYVATDHSASSFAASLIAVNLQSGRQHVLLYGLNKVASLAQAGDGTLWLGEGFAEGLVWRITEPATLPEEQQVYRLRQTSDSPAVAPFTAAGVFHHSAIVFGRYQRFCYLADGQQGGGLYRLQLADHQLQVWGENGGWHIISHPDEAATEAGSRQARRFSAIRSMTRLDDGRILLAEGTSGHILALRDGDKPVLTEWLNKPAIHHPQSLAWDHQRQLLWISDQSGSASRLWAWDGRNLLDVAHHQAGSIDGLYVYQGRVLANIRRSKGAPEAVIEIMEKGQR